MHASSLENMQRCFQKYVKNWNWKSRKNISVIDIGGMNINGSYADIFSGPEFTYKAADIVPSEYVDIVLKDPYHLPFEDGRHEIIISGQAFEHVEFFWELFREMVRVLNQGGMIILIAPSSGPIHKYPVDCYRFYPDAYVALAKYTGINLIDVWKDDRGPWQDVVGVFSKQSMEKGREEEVDYSHGLWSPNQYELDYSPINQVEKSHNEEVEEKKGDVHYLKVLAQLHEKLHPDFYLEIGVRLGKSLQLASCESVGVDPQFDIKVDLGSNHRLLRTSSDEFFEERENDALRLKKIDIAFIDGMHLFEFVIRDFINVEKNSSGHTVVVIDDIYPNHLLQAERKRCSQVWTGDVWKVTHCLGKFRPDLQLTYLNAYPTGLLIVTGLKADNKVLVNRYNPLIRQYRDMQLEGEAQVNILERKEAIDSFSKVYWDWLEKFVREKKLASCAQKKKC